MVQTLEIERRPGSAEQRAEVAASFQASIHIFKTMGAHLFSELCRGALDDDAMLELGRHAMGGARPAHLFCAVHYLVLGEPAHPIARFFATLTDTPAPPEDAYPEIAAFCRERRAEILDLLESRTVQTTYVERCRALMPLVAFVADRVGEPLNLIEIGCSAGVLLTFDKYAYDVPGSGRIGGADAPLLLDADISGGPRPRIATIARRIGLDLHLLNAGSEEDRRWLLALCFPELRLEQQRLAAALVVVATTEIEFREGDAMVHLRAVLAETPDPVCIFSSACLLYWSAEGRAALEALLTEESKGRTFYRISLEPDAAFDAWAKGRKPGEGGPLGATVSLYRYSNGVAERRIVAEKLGALGGIRWTDARAF